MKAQLPVWHQDKCLPDRHTWGDPTPVPLCLRDRRPRHGDGRISREGTKLELGEQPRDLCAVHAQGRSLPSLAD